ncbi:NlpC/P60 family protein [Corynebacterium sp. zg254]|uniref:NlpC/P60 family protein n=1 Tax=Corynebacterium zhongnanshanii TaxID=2768834 RepID=A0ABQ6VEU1_9CORY|nr:MULTISPECIES: C40 family peptidase [Corynebacterium]KAB3522937.1 NlpC/P60 family protein [Corynebacterium zhongnanshanii]MCR5913985.1 NlpC/P60 family protein [Corynebacterium sp. zg254]
MMTHLMEPLVAAIPRPLSTPLRAVIPGDADVRQLAHDVHRMASDGLTGMAAEAVARATQRDAQQLMQACAAGELLDALGEQARGAVQAAIADITRLAQECGARLMQAAAACVATSPAGAHPAALMAVLVPIAQEHYARAEVRLQQLHAELDHLANRVAAVDIPTVGEAAARSRDPAAPASMDAAAAHGGVAEAAHGGASLKAQAAVAAAKSALGTPYQWGGNTPGVGMDCSGLTHWAYAQAGVDIPRTADAQAVGPAIPRGQVQPGDLAVWDGHVAMVVDSGHFIEAGDPIQISPIRETNMGMNFKGFYRPAAQ